MSIQKATKRIQLLFASLILISLISCVKKIDEYSEMPEVPGVDSNLLQVEIPPTFDFQSEKSVLLNIHLLSNSNDPLSGIKIRILENSILPEDKILATGMTDSNGDLNIKLVIPKMLNEVIVNADYIGIVNNVVMDVTGTGGSITLGGNKTATFLSSRANNTILPTGSNLHFSTPYPIRKYLGTWNNYGVPHYLTNTRDIINPSFLARINAAIPESKSVPIFHPEYIANAAQSTIEISQTADVWMTFVHEAAGYLNTIGYYIYNKNNPPTSKTSISQLKIVFPNFSYYNSGGGLVSGDKVKLGTFGPDTVIGFILIANGFNSTTHTVGNGVAQYYSHSKFNPEQSDALRRHNIVLWDEIEQKMVIGFEDLNRGTGCDNDFNDAVFTISSYPSNAITSPHIGTTGTPVDTDHDGVSDVFDDFPNDATLAYNSYYPSNNTYGHLAFEDLWPYRGDYDFNDLVVGYRFNTIRNSANLVKAIDAKIYVKAIGGSYENGFGIELPIASGIVSSVTGARINENYITLNGNGTEASQNKAVIIAFDNASNIAKRPAGYYVNTQIGSPVVISDTISMRITFGTPQSAQAIGSAPFNPFIISNKRRGYEIHLPNSTPTNLADVTLLNTGNDKSNAALGRYYRSDKNMPWALNIPYQFPVVIEKKQITDAYLKFLPWAQSGGVIYTDWYTSKPGYRNQANILNR